MLATPRLRLLPADRSHLEALHRIWNEPEVRKYLWDDQPVTWEQAELTLAAGSLWTLLAKGHHPGSGLLRATLDGEGVKSVLGGGCWRKRVARSRR